LQFCHFNKTFHIIFGKGLHLQIIIFLLSKRNGLRGDIVLSRDSHNQFRVFQDLITLPVHWLCPERVHRLHCLITRCSTVSFTWDSVLLRTLDLP
jgi:hypothetical protein